MSVVTNQRVSYLDVLYFVMMVVSVFDVSAVASQTSIMSPCNGSMILISCVIFLFLHLFFGIKTDDAEV